MSELSRKFETEVCGRCAGSGTHSYNMIHGDVCYGCMGKKIRRTKRGQKAFEFYLTLVTKSVTEIVVGDCIEFSGKVRKVSSIEKDMQSGSSMVDGVMVPYCLPVLEITTVDGYAVRVFESQTVRYYPNGQEKIDKLNQAYDYQETLNEKGVQLKRKVKTAK